ncbi:MAG: hypothetical protein A2Z07_04800 [Armatimonadetes bacterium RBG_16_67_12]|nr:MAG: hypothetical protein A2Z07_04800 [Armatimonadetes bacterium RBG_16_67_12]
MRLALAAFALVILALVAAPALAEPGYESGDREVNAQARTFFDQGMDHIKKKQWALAIQSFMQAVRIEPQYVEAWNNLGYAYRKNTDNQRALDAYKRALEIRPDYKYAHEYIGRLYVALGNRAMAMRHYEILRRLDAKLAAELLRAIEANDADLGDG